MDNYQAGILTAQEFIRRGGTKGKLALVHNNAISSNLKKEGVLDTLRSTEWKLVVEADGLTNTDTDTATKVAIELLRNHPELPGVIGLSSSSGGLSAEKTRGYTGCSRFTGTRPCSSSRKSGCGSYCGT